MIINKSKNWLLIIGIIAAVLCLVFYIFIGSDHPYEGSRNYSDKSLKLMLIAAVIIAPLLEEIAFRGFFTDKNWMRVTSFIVLPLFVFTGFTSEEWFVILPTIFFITTYLLSLKFKNPIIVNFTIILNVLLFTSIHYTLEDLISPNYFFYPLAQISAGCLLIWITINFNLLKSMLFHFLWNVFFVVILIYGLQFPNTETKTFSNETIHVEWVEVPLFSKENTKIRVTDNLIEGINVEARFLYKIISRGKAPDDQILQYEPYLKYNITVHNLDIITTNETFQKETLKFLENQELVYLKEGD